MPQPNILIFNPDQMRADALGHLGNAAAHTPNFDALLTDGVSFRNAFVQNPICTPSRCSFMSGWYPHVRGHRTIAHMMRPDEPVLLRELKNAGYHVWVDERGDLLPGDNKNAYKGYADTVFVPKKKLDMQGGATPRGEADGGNYYSMYRGIIPTAKGRDDIYDMDAAWVEGAERFIRKPPKNKPFCLFLPLQYPHPPYQIAQKYYDEIDPAKIPPRIPTPDWDAAGKPSILKGICALQNLGGWDEPRWAELRRVYLAMCARVDAQFGQIVAALKESGQYDNTAIFVFSDHGDFTGDYGLTEKNQNTFEDCLTRVPFLVKPPKGIPIQPGIRENPVELVDFYATAAALSGITPDHTHFGKSLLPLLADDAASHRDYVFSEGGRLHSEPHCNESYYQKDIVSPEVYYYPRMKMQESQGPEHTKATMIRSRTHKYVHRLYEKDELYDLQKDPGEQYNVIDEPAYAAELMTLKQEMLRWYQETADAVPYEEDSRAAHGVVLTYAKSATPYPAYLGVRLLLALGVKPSSIAALGLRINRKRGNG